MKSKEAFSTTRRFLMGSTTTAAAVLGCTLFAAGCENGKDVDFRTVVNDEQSAISETRSELINTQEAWDALWSEHAGITGEAQPGITFPTEQAIAVFDGNKPNGSYSIEITKVVVDGSVLHVHTRRTRAGQDCSTLAVVVQPHHIIAIEKADVPENSTVELESEADVVKGCTPIR